MAFFQPNSSSYFDHQIYIAVQVVYNVVLISYNECIVIIFRVTTVTDQVGVTSFEAVFLSITDVVAEKKEPRKRYNMKVSSLEFGITLGLAKIVSPCSED